MSRFSDIQKAGATVLISSGAFGQVRTVANGLVIANQTGLQYPAALWAIKEAIRGPHEGVSDTQLFDYTVNAFVVVIANSDGSELGDAREFGWHLVDAVLHAFANFVPTLAAINISAAPCEPGNIEPVEVDAGQSAYYIPLTFQLFWS